MVDALAAVPTDDDANETDRPTAVAVMTRLNTLGSHQSSVGGRREEKVMMAAEVTLPLFNNGLSV